MDNTSTLAKNLALLIADHLLLFTGLWLLFALAVTVGAWKYLNSREHTLFSALQRLWRLLTQFKWVQTFGLRHPSLWRFIDKRFDPDEYLGLHLTLGILVAVTAVAGFGELADTITEHEAVVAFDQRLMQLLAERNTAFKATWAGWMTHAGDPILILVIGMLIGVLLLAKRAHILLAGWTVALLGTWILNVTLKHTFQRPRPPGAVEILPTHSWSFPSGHAMGSMVAYGMLAYVLGVLLQQRCGPCFPLSAVVVITLVGVSRVLLGVHYPTDVLAGFLAGATWLAICISGTEIARRRQAIDNWTDRTGKWND